MEFGTISDVKEIESISWDLPPKDPIFFRSSAVVPKLDIFYAAPVWIAPEWMGNVYPPKTPQNKFLYHYSRRFNAIELNMTFYRAPTTAMVARWNTETPDTFRFCPKILQNLSRAKNLNVTRSDIQAFCDSLRPLGPKLGPFFLQLPPHFHWGQFQFLIQFIEWFPNDLQLAVEFRNPTFFVDVGHHRQLRSDVAEVLAAKNVTGLITDTSGRRDVLHTSLTTRQPMIRFLGNELHHSDFFRLKAWISRFDAWRLQGVTHVYFFLHHPTYLNVPHLADYFVKACDEIVSATPQSSLTFSDPSARFSVSQSEKKERIS